MLGADLDAQDGRLAAEAHGADAKLVGFLVQCLFQVSQLFFYLFGN